MEAALAVRRSLNKSQTAGILLSTRGGGVDGHVVRGVVQELGPCVALNVVGVVIPPSQLHIQPVLLGSLLVEDIVGVRHQAGLGHLPTVGREEQDVGAGGVHLVGLARVDGLLLHSFDFQSVQLLVEHLTPVDKEAT